MHTLITSVIAFVSTNIDDTLLLMLFFGDSRINRRDIVLGQLIGIGVLVLISVVLSLVGLIIDAAYVGFLGLIPIYLGAKGIAALFRRQGEDKSDTLEPGRNNILAISGVTIANGGDNIGIYVPLFAAFGWPEKAVMVGVFFVMTLLLCLLAKFLTSHPLIAAGIDRYGHMVSPVVLILLGLYILYESGALQLLF